MKYGSVVKFDPTTGEGFIAPANRGRSVKFRYLDGRHPKGTINLAFEAKRNSVGVPDLMPPNVGDEVCYTVEDKDSKFALNWGYAPEKPMSPQLLRSHLV
ncbi:MAG TPA: hypothetical protein VLF21_03350 [Candidatus Saccharimonadales bacterium]|nr:hypothetical protein [Candidatus Saccharimonadales bacterium]